MSVLKVKNTDGSWKVMGGTAGNSSTDLVEHTHSTSDITSGTLPITRGGTGATSAADARTKLGITPANIGAVKNTGDTMTGNLTVKKDSGESDIFVKSGDNTFTIYNTGTVAGLYDSTNNNGILTYNLTDKKITKLDVEPSVIGAVAKTGDTMTGNLNISRNNAEASVILDSGTSKMGVYANTSNNMGLFDKTSGSGSAILRYNADSKKITTLADFANPLSIANGGTGASDAINAIKNLMQRATNTVPATDTPTAWAELGTFIAYYNANSTIINKPTSYGILLSYAIGTMVSQLWIVNQTGRLYIRFGNSTGWTANADVTGADAWVEYYNSKNKVPLANGGTSADLTVAPKFSIIRMNNEADNLYYTPTAKGAFFATGANLEPKFDTLPVTLGGTGGTSKAAARTNLGALSKEGSDTTAGVITSACSGCGFIANNTTKNNSMKVWNSDSGYCGLYDITNDQAIIGYDWSAKKVYKIQGCSMTYSSGTLSITWSAG